MFDPKKLLDDLLGSNVPGTGGTVRDGAGKAMRMAKDNPLAAGALVAVLLGTSTGRSVTGTAAKVGGLAAIGGLAYHAYKNWQAGKDTSETASSQPEMLPPPSDTGFHPDNAPQGDAEFALSLIRAMIAAAKADGHIDEEERKRISDKLSLAGIGGDAEKFLMAELEAPLDLDALAAAAKTEEQKVELYAASRLAIDPNSRAERGYLDLLAGRLGLPDALIDHVEATVSAAKASVPAEPASAPEPAPAPSTTPKVNPRW
ncbi:tellurite resistance TerB family protein [Mesorhizobium sp. LHD-90]|uniref:tellurite resistance TerB family protein n=1 Tax=Mesorhizobium sp. LHD-90 TaxID=3071414 RepID=UPI0027E1EE91|nr:tellurite resistance TerB family protein [Mesorhizobium sp. LHD-90]MDQ6433681.1 tellurite resistance TerB family protein [Mesorhizobium sp. LHD-90]